MASRSKPGKIHLRIIEVMKRFPGGISGGQIRQELEREGLDAGEQTHLDRRKRDLKKWFVIKKDTATVVVNGQSRKVTVYRYAGIKRNIVDEGQISLKNAPKSFTAPMAVVRCVANRSSSMGSRLLWITRNHGIGAEPMPGTTSGRSAKSAMRERKPTSHPCTSRLN